MAEEENQNKTLAANLEQREGGRFLPLLLVSSVHRPSFSPTVSPQRWNTWFIAGSAINNSTPSQTYNGSRGGTLTLCLTINQEKEEKEGERGRDRHGVRQIERCRGRQEVMGERLRRIYKCFLKYKQPSANIALLLSPSPALPLTLPLSLSGSAPLRPVNNGWWWWWWFGGDVLGTDSNMHHE